MSALPHDEIAVTAARLVVEDGMEYGPAKRRAAKLLGLSLRNSSLPDNDRLEDEIRTYLQLFRADSQPAELLALRTLALGWMERLARFRPHMAGAVWRGTATRLNAVHLELFCDDSKEAELALIELHIDFDVATTTGPRGRQVDVLRVGSLSREPGERVTVHLTVLDYDDLRGALRGDARGRAQRGDLAAVRALVAAA